ncbi:CD1375 family protein [Paenibacillus wynnii]|nr:CD1375 family protein [Paenibacillus wynnii]
MVTVYVSLIVKGFKTFAQVPASLQPAVKAELEALGSGTDGKPSVTV